MGGLQLTSWQTGCVYQNLAPRDKEEQAGICEITLFTVLFIVTVIKATSFAADAVYTLV
jgi:hypothetical protein